MNIGFFAGSFSPFTNGHLHIVKTASKFLDKVIVGIGINQNKLPRFDNNDMKVAIEKTLEKEGLTNVEVIIYTTLSVDAAMEHGASVLIRGLRNSIDYEYEEKLALINEDFSGLDTFYIRAGSLGNISSSLIMELLEHGKDASKYLPEDVWNLVKTKYNQE